MLRGYALFDFDGTLCAGDSIIRFVMYCRRRGICGAGGIARAAGGAALYALRLKSAESSKRAALRFLAGRGEDEIRAVCEDFCAEVLIPRLRPEGLRELRLRKDEGCVALLTTASPSFYLEPLKARLGFEHILGTRMDVVDGRYTGLICGDNCKGIQKPLRLAEYLAAKGDRLDYDRSSAYGDSAGDAATLALCARKVAVNPKRGLLKRLRGEKGVVVVRWAEPDKSTREREA